MKVERLAVVLALLLSATLSSQQPAASKPAPASMSATEPSPASQPSDAYKYEPDGRRDPFLSLLGTGGDWRAPSKKGDGTASLTVSEISVRGIVESRGTLVAMIQGPDSKTYIVHQGDKLADGKIKTITSTGLVVVQDVNDPLSLVKQREVRKLLRSLEDAKE
jgi:Tfp pilus assembly protein PilP